MGEKLEACPFCGGIARLDFGKVAFEDAEVSCDGCGTQGPNCDDGYGREDNQRLAIAAWNTRATPDRSDDALAEENRRLREALTEIERLQEDRRSDAGKWQVAKVIARAALKGHGL